MQSEWQLRREIVEIGKRAYDRNFVTATDGNISVRVMGDRLLITPSGSCLGELKPEHLIYVDMDGKVFGGKGKPTSELPMHLTVYRERSDIKAVIHAHPPITTGFTIAGESLAQCVIPEVVMMFGTIPTTEYATPATEQGANVIKKLIKDNDALILDRHGTLTVGKNLMGAYRKLEKVEYCARVTVTAFQLGRIKTLSVEEIEEIEAIRTKHGYSDRASLCKECRICQTND